MNNLNQLEKFLKLREQELSESMVVRTGNWVHESPRRDEYMIRCQELNVVLSAIYDLKQGKLND